MNYFSEEETTCKCGCGYNDMDGTFMKKLNLARRVAGIPFVVNSGFRCEAHNRAINGSVNSSHMRGLAIDIACDKSKDRSTILDALREVGFTRIGIASTFIHVDSDFNKTQNVAWVY